MTPPPPSRNAAGRTLPARNHPAHLGRGVRTQRATVLAGRAQRRDQASADLWLAVTTAHPEQLFHHPHPATEATATTGVLALDTIALAHGGLHTLAVCVAGLCAIAYLAIIVQTLRWRARIRTAHQDFAALPSNRKAAALTEYNELRQLSPALFTHPMPPELAHTA